MIVSDRRFRFCRHWLTVVRRCFISKGYLRKVTVEKSVNFLKINRTFFFEFEFIGSSTASLIGSWMWMWLVSSWKGINNRYEVFLQWIRQIVQLWTDKEREKEFRRKWRRKANRNRCLSSWSKIVFSFLFLCFSFSFVFRLLFFSLHTSFRLRFLSDMVK